MDLFTLPDFDGHEQVVFGHDRATGLRAILAIHSTALGPAAGGCRMWAYPSSDEALTDVLRLSRGMSYKNAMAELDFGGGKAVIIGDARAHKSPALFQAFGRLVESLGGRYITAEDVGTTTADMEQVATQTRFVSGLARKRGEVGGDPGPKTALGVFLGIRAAVRFQLGRSLEGVGVAVQGLGGVGHPLCRLLAADGARLTVADARTELAQQVGDELGATVVPAEAILEQQAEVLAPCALGAVLNERSIPRLRVRVVAGAANNQLAREADGQALMKAGILYAPDYVINAGGIINVAHEYHGGSSEAAVRAAIEKIPERLSAIFERARRESLPTSVVADQMARERLQAGRAG
ncbi:MAG: Glu/Leu/Phe/Val family dehydrogenase [Steroidobacteraceae bacterium]